MLQVNCTFVKGHVGANVFKTAVRWGRRSVVLAGGCRASGRHFNSRPALFYYPQYFEKRSSQPLKLAPLSIAVSHKSFSLCAQHSMCGCPAGRRFSHLLPDGLPLSCTQSHEMGEKTIISILYPVPAFTLKGSGNKRCSCPITTLLAPT